MLKEEYQRVYKNFDKCMQAFEEIIKICQIQRNYVVASIIEECLSSLEQPKQKEN